MAGYASPPPQHSGLPQPHPYLHEPMLYISNLPPYVTDDNLAMAFQSCAPFRPVIPRDGSNHLLNGTIEFKFLDKGTFDILCYVENSHGQNPVAEKALATLQSRCIQGLQPPACLVLSPYPPTIPPTPLPPSSALPRLVKHLPVGYTDSQLYDLFRPFGALASVRMQTGFGSDSGIVEFWREEDACVAEEAMHCVEIEGQNIAVTIFQNRRTSGGPTEISARAPPFVPIGALQVRVHPATRIYLSKNIQYPHLYESRGPFFMHGPGQQVQWAPISGPGSNSHSGLIDPCNLFCKVVDDFDMKQTTDPFA